MLKNSGWNAAALAAGVVALAVGGPWLVGHLKTLPDARALAARSDERIVTLQVGGMTCAGCAAKIQGELASMAGVSEAQVRLGAERAYVVCDRALPDTALVGAVRRAGPGFVVSVLGR